jgi:hypothetical protein
VKIALLGVAELVCELQLSSRIVTCEPPGGIGLPLAYP